ncbi:hypothetical protein AKJ09_08987 [Labilithrix luteola]|uniref:Helix-turn-helix domain-containing protein n=1 Tax=Labilithrix luteola TaxID=1391654 RepID=A0A0K1Q9B5_9BACT|nr:hypothetical protein [Labilithrix luteola]AKV02324.1 hypothetical protein AKJ09_08987 [Labilithrix luteola]
MTTLDLLFAVRDLKDDRLRAVHRSVLVGILMFWNKRINAYDPTTQQIADAMGLGRSSVHRTITELRQWGVLRVTIRGAHRSSLYELVVSGRNSLHAEDHSAAQAPDLSERDLSEQEVSEREARPLGAREVTSRSERLDLSERDPLRISSEDLFLRISPEDKQTDVADAPVFVVEPAKVETEKPEKPKAEKSAKAKPTRAQARRDEKAASQAAYRKAFEEARLEVRQTLVGELAPIKPAHVAANDADCGAATGSPSAFQSTKHHEAVQTPAASPEAFQLVTSEGADPKTPRPEREVFEYWLAGWRRVVNGTRPPVFSDGRRKKIQSRIREGYSVADLKLACDGLWADSWYVEKQQHDIDLVCRDAVHVDRFMAKAPPPPIVEPPPIEYGPPVVGPELAVWLEKLRATLPDEPVDPWLVDLTAYPEAEAS